jgi:hypothetical protein
MASSRFGTYRTPHKKMVSMDDEMCLVGERCQIVAQQQMSLAPNPSRP